MKTIQPKQLLLLIACALISTHGFAQFSGYYDPANWTTTISPSNSGGSVNTASAPASVSIVSGNSGMQGDIDFSILMPAAGNVSFDWSYSTADGAEWDYPEYAINGAVFPMPGYDMGGGSTQNGTANIPVSAGDVLALRMHTVDGTGGAATTVFSNLTVPLLPACSGIPAAGTASAPSLVCQNANFNLTAAGFTVGSGISFQWQSSPAAAGIWTDILDADTSFYTVTGGIAAATDFRLVVTCTNSSQTDTSNVVNVVADIANPCTIITTRLVDSSATGANNGTSWADAYTSLADAVQEAHSNPAITTILIAKGTYFPEILAGTGATDRDKAFTFTRSGLAVLGGFPSGGGAVRDWTANPVILSGDIGVPGDNSDNVYHVVITAGASVDNTLVIDGLTITKGNANGFLGGTVVNGIGFGRGYGGGIANISSAPMFNHIIIESNTATQGGGISNISSAPVFNHIIIESNTTTNLGGGMFNEDAYPVLTHALISDNSGAAIFFFGTIIPVSSPILTDVIISGNIGDGIGCFAPSALTSSTPILTNVLISGNTGKGIDNDEAVSTLTNVTISGNLNGGIQIFGGSTNILIRNSIIFGNGGFGIFSGSPTIHNSLIQGIPGGINGNLDGTALNPFFVDPVAFTGAPTTAGDYRLQSGSPCIDAGDNGFISSGISTDLDGNLRIANSTVDMGTYEFGSTPLPLSLLSFRAQENNCLVTLDWQVADISEAARFDVQQSRDGVSFGTIGKVLPLAGADRYSFKTPQPAQKAYYRLKTEAYNGNIAYSKVLAVTASCGKEDIAAFPNPVREEMTVNGLQQGQRLHITDVAGRIIYRAVAAGGTAHISMAAFAPGIYYLKIMTNEGAPVKALKMVKE